LKKPVKINVNRVCDKKDRIVNLSFIHKKNKIQIYINF
jgi:hypothetical protein